MVALTVPAGRSTLPSTPYVSSPYFEREAMTRKRLSRGSGAILACVIFMLAACGGEDSSGNAPEAAGKGPEATTSGNTGTSGRTTAAPEEAAAGDALTPAEAT